MERTSDINGCMRSIPWLPKRTTKKRTGEKPARIFKEQISCGIYRNDVLPYGPYGEHAIAYYKCQKRRAWADTLYLDA